MVCFAFHYFHMLCNVHEHGWPQLGFPSGLFLSLYFSWLIMQEVAKLNLLFLEMASSLQWLESWFSLLAVSIELITETNERVRKFGHRY